MATHSIILAWKIPWIEEPCRLQSMGCEESDTTKQLHFHFFFHKFQVGTQWIRGFPNDSDIKESACNAGDLGLIPWLGRSSGEGNGYPFQYSCLENSLERGAWRAAVHGVTKSWTLLSN